MAINLHRSTVIVATLLVGALVLTGCRSKSRDGVVQVDENDAAMNAAITKARATVNQFSQALNRPKPNQRGFSVKKAFNQSGKIEHMWLNDVEFDGKQFVGFLANDPRSVRNLKRGDRVTAAPNEISDWMYIENNRLMGGYTIRVLRDKLSTKERADFDRSMDFKID